MYTEAHKDNNHQWFGLLSQLEFNGTHTRALIRACIHLVYTIVFEEVRCVDLIVHARLLSYSDHEATFVSIRSS